MHPGNNLTRDEARRRAELIQTPLYDISLDLTLDSDTFACERVRAADFFRCAGCPRAQVERQLIGTRQVRLVDHPKVGDFEQTLRTCRSNSMNLSSSFPPQRGQYLTHVESMLC